MNDLKYQLGIDLESLSYKIIRDQHDDQVCNQVWDQSYHQLRDQLCDQLLNQLQDQCYDQLRYQ